MHTISDRNKLLSNLLLETHSVCMYVVLSSGKLPVNSYVQKKMLDSACEQETVYSSHPSILEISPTSLIVTMGEGRGGELSSTVHLLDSN